MLLKVSYIFLGYLLVDGFFLNTYGANVTLTFDMTAPPINNEVSCFASVMGNPIRNLTVNYGDQINVKFMNTNLMNHIRCFLDSQIPISMRNLKAHSVDTRTVYSHTIKNVTYEYAGFWSCWILTLRGNPDIPIKARVVYENEYLMEHLCNFTLSVVLPKNNTIQDTGVPKLWIYVAIGVVVAVIIIAQTAVILYLKIKAKRTPRLGSLTLRTNNRDPKDTKRYSQPPGVRKSRLSRMLRKNNDKDEDTIYETLGELKNAGEQTPPVPPIETIPTLKKKQNYMKQESAELISKSLPRPVKPKPVLPMSATLNRIPERDKSAKSNISTRPPLPLPIQQPDDRSATPLQRTLVPPNEKAGHSSTRPLGGIGQAFVASELDSILKMRKVASDSPYSGQDKFVPEAPNPLPTGKSAIILGLAPNTASEMNATNPRMNPVPNGIHPAPFRANPPPKPFKLPNTPLKPVARNTPLITPAASDIPPVAAGMSVKALAGSLSIPRPPMSPSVAPKAPAKPPPSVMIPKPNMISDHPGNTFNHVPQKVPPKPMMNPNLHLSRFERLAPQIPASSIGKPPILPPANEPLEEAIYEESDEPLYNEEYSPSPQGPGFAKPDLQQSPPTGQLPPLPPPNQSTQEDVYEKYADEPVYNSDDEWDFEALKPYNIYSI